MKVEKDQKYSRRGKIYTVLTVNKDYHFTYIKVLEDGLKNTLENCRVFGVVAFEEAFNLMNKEVKDG